MGIYGEKKAAMSKAMMNEDVNGPMLEERAYGNTKSVDAQKDIASKQHTRTFQWYVDPKLVARDEVMAKILSNALLDPSGSPVWWTYIKKTAGDALIHEIGNALFRPDGGWISVNKPYLKSFAVIAIMAYCRLPGFVRKRVSSLMLPIWRVPKVAKVVKVVEAGLKEIVSFQKNAIKGEYLEISVDGDIMSYYYKKCSTILLPSSLILAKIESRSNYELEQARADDML